MLHKIFTKRNYRIVVATPYENQVRLLFMRINEILQTSPLLSKEVTRNTKNPYVLQLKNGSAIIGFTTGTDAASVRGQKADWIYLDEVDYMSDVCYDAVTAIAAERASIGLTMSSTPTGKRSHFYFACVDKRRGFKEHYHPSTHNPNWGPAMEAEFRAQLTESAYVHEIMAEFGSQEMGVYPKNKIDESQNVLNFAYNQLTYDQRIKLDRGEAEAPKMMIYNKHNRAPMNPFRTMGVDWDKFGASSSILIMDYNVKYQKFMVIKRVEVPKTEYSYDKAVNTIIELNEIYNPSYIYCDAGSGEYQIERLHMYGEQHPHSGLKNKVKRWHLSKTLDITDPITGEIEKKPVKPFMVNQLTISFERDRIMMSPWDEVLSKQLTDYEVERVSQSGQPIFTSKDEHFCDAMGLAHLAFALEFKDLTNTIKDFEVASKMKASVKNVSKIAKSKMYRDIQNSYASTRRGNHSRNDDDDLPGDKPSAIRVPMSALRRGKSRSSWGQRGGGYGSARSMW